MSIASLFLTTILLVPTLISYLNVQERIESKDGPQHFLHDHENIIETYVFLFIGIFIGFLIIGAFVGEPALSYQFKFLSNNGVNEAAVTSVPDSNMHSVLVIMGQNLTVDVIAFLFSIFYGSGAIFLIVFNASIFASFAVLVSQLIAKSLPHVASVIGAFSIHLIPEITGFLLAAIAGGVLSKALMNEKIGSDSFNNVIKDCTILFIMSVLLIALAAFLEIYVTRGAFRMILQQ
jgi:hypothetical protein